MRPKIRVDLRVTVQVYGGQTCYVIEDVLCSRFFRLGIAEYTFVSLLDGQTTIAGAISQTAVICGSAALDEREAATLCKWLLESSLATTEQSASESRLDESRSKRQTRTMIGQANPMIQKIPLFNPMPILKRFDPLAMFCFSFFGFLVWAAVVISGTVALWGSWDDFATRGNQVLTRANWLWLLTTWLVLKSIHEISHALACRRFGGHVRQSGIVLILLAPMPYVDVTSVWRIDNKWKRILISAAGIYAEIFCAAIAAIIWSFSFDPLIRQHAMNVIVTATLMTLVFNANPLMRFDGYYILTDWIEMPNLATHSRQWVSYAMRRYFMGIHVPCPNWSEGRHSFVVLYAIAATVWRIIVSVSLAVSAEVMMHGAGIVIAFCAVSLWVGLPLFKSIQSIAQNRTADRRRMLAISVCAVSSAWLCWSVVPWYSRSTVPLIVDYHPPQEVRVAVDGFLDQNLVSSGDVVTRGQVLALLSNRELELEFQNLLLDLEKSEVRHRGYLANEMIAAAQVEQKTQATLRSRCRQIRKQIDGLIVRAPVDGVIATSDLDSRENTVINRGDRLFVVGARNSQKIVGLVDQTDVDAYRAAEGQSLEIQIWGMGNQRISGTIERVLPRASLSLSYPALGAEAGGPLAVRRNQESSDDQDLMQLVDPRFPILIDFAGFESEILKPSQTLKPGQTGYARLSYRNGTIGQALWNSLGQWIEDKRAILKVEG